MSLENSNNYILVHLIRFMGELRILNLANDENLIRIIQKKEQESGNILSKEEIRKHLDRLDSRIINLIKDVEIRKGHNPYKHGLGLIRKSQKTAQLLGCSDDEVKLIGLASYLHDIGKCEIGKEILNKPSQLTLEEYKIIQHHVLLGEKIVLPFKYIAKLVKCHHERCDGRGYMEGLKDDEIPLGAKIIAVVDTFNAITHLRVYDPGHPKEFAVNEIKRCSGLEFDLDYLKNFRLNVLKEMAKDATVEQYQQKLLELLCKKGEFEYEKEKEKTIGQLEADYLYTRLRSEEQLDKNVAKAFFEVLKESNNIDANKNGFGYLQVIQR